MSTNDKLEAFRARLESEMKGAATDRYGYKAARIKMGRKYANIDVGSGFGDKHTYHWSGKYMVDLATGEIFGIKSYGVIHRGHKYGTLDTAAEWNWSGYVAVANQGIAHKQPKGE